MALRGFYLELDELLDDGFSGQVVLHCSEGQIVKYDIKQTKRPKNGIVSIREITGAEVDEWQDIG